MNIVPKSRGNGVKILNLSPNRNAVTTEVGIMKEGMAQIDKRVWVVSKEFGASTYPMCFQ